MRFAPDEPWRLNLLDYELKRGGAGAGQTENIVSLQSTILEIAQRSQGGQGRADEGYWLNASQQMQRCAVDLLKLTTGRVSAPDMYRLIASAPQTPEQVNDPKWQERSFCAKCIRAAKQRLASGALSPRDANDLNIALDYFEFEFPSLSEKTRSIVVSTFTSMIDVFQRGAMRELFCTGINIVPEACWVDGKIVVVDLPIHEWGKVGLYAQVAMKYLFQQAISRRDVSKNPRPCFLWADESHFFTTSKDADFQTTAGGSRCATVYLTQNINNYYAALGGEDAARPMVDSLMGNLQTKVFHANGDAATNRYASEMIGQSRHLYFSGGPSQEPYDPLDFFDEHRSYASCSFMEHKDFDVDPREFTLLRTGGAGNDFLTDCILFQNGRVFSNGRTFMHLTLKQRI